MKLITGRYLSERLQVSPPLIEEMVDPGVIVGVVNCILVAHLKIFRLDYAKQGNVCVLN